MLIRTEAPADILAIDHLLKSTFETHAEANLVMMLRENSHLTLSLVACNDEGELVGHIMFSPVLLNDNDLNWQGLAPLAIKPAYHNQGIGSELVREGLITLTDFGYPACVVLGDPTYYQRFGFEDAQMYSLYCQWEVPQGAFQVVALLENELTNKSGMVKYCSEFSEL